MSRSCLAVRETHAGPSVRSAPKLRSIGRVLPMAGLVRFAARNAAVLAGVALMGCATDDLPPEAPYVPFAPEVTVVEGARAVIERPTGLTATGARDFGLPPARGLPLQRAETPTDGHLYTLADLIDLAQMNNPETRVSWDQARQAAAAVGIARALYLPVVTATVVGGYQHLSSSGGLGNGTMSGGTASGTSAASGAVPTSASADVNGTVSSGALQWLLFDFGVRDALTASARNLLLGRNIAFNGVHQKIIYDVSRRFFDFSSARQAVALTAKARVESAYLLKASQGRFHQGLDTSVEVAQARRLLAQADLDLVRAQGGERDAYHSLIAAVGISPTSALRIQDVSGRPLPAAPPVSVERLVADALRRRPDIQVGLAGVQAAHSDIVAAQAEFLPKVFLSTSGAYTTGNLNVTSLPSLGSLTQGNSNSGAAGTSTTQSNATVLGGVTIPIYDGGVREARLETARDKADAAESTVVRLQQNAAAEIVAADDALRTSVASYRAAGILVQASGTAEDAAFSAYKSGFGSLTAAIEAEKALQDARLSREQAHGTALIAASTLAFAAGRLSSSDVVPGGGLPSSPL